MAILICPILTKKGDYEGGNNAKEWMQLNFNCGVSCNDCDSFAKTERQGG